MMELKKGFIYFKNHDKIKLLEVPNFGSVTLKVQDSVVVSSERTETKIYNKNTD